MSNQNQLPERVDTRLVKRAVEACAKDVMVHLRTSRRSAHAEVWLRAAYRQLCTAQQGARDKDWEFGVDMAREVILEAVRYGYEPGHHCYFIPYAGKNPKLVCLTSYKGIYETCNSMEDCMMRPPILVYTGDTWEWEPARMYDDGTVRPYFRHVPSADDLYDASKLRGVYVVGRIRGEVYVEWVPKAYVERVKAVGKRRPGDTPWEGPFEPEMWRKTGARYGSKYYPQGLPFLSGDMLFEGVPDENADGQTYDMEPGSFAVDDDDGQATGNGERTEQQEQRPQQQRQPDPEKPAPQIEQRRQTDLEQQFEQRPAQSEQQQQREPVPAQQRQTGQGGDAPQQQQQPTDDPNDPGPDADNPFAGLGRL